MTDPYALSLLIGIAIGLLCTGAVAGVLAGLLGVGGGIVIVPVLYLLFDVLQVPQQVAMHLAVGTSLATIIPTSVSSARSHHAKGAIDHALLRLWGPYVFLGALAGGILSKVVASEALTLIFGGIALVVSINMAIPGTLVLSDGLPENQTGKRAIPSGVGVLSALMGIGGGTLSVPILSAFSFPVHRAVGTASVFGLVIAVPAAAGFMWSGYRVDLRPPLSVGYVNLPAAVLIFSMSVLTAPLGAKLAHHLAPAMLKKAFAAFLFLTALKMLGSSVGL